MALFSASYLRCLTRCSTINIDGGVYPKREPCYKNDSWLDRIKLAYGVLTGKYDAVSWYKQ